MKQVLQSLVAVSSLALVACGSSSSSDSSGTGTFSLGLTDGPVESASEVVVSFTSVQVQGEESKVIELDPAMSINLLDYQGDSRTMLLEGETFEAGEYQWIRLGVDETASYIEIDGLQYPLEIPSGAQTGLKLNRGFTIGAGSTTDFTIDFDLRKSVHQEGTGDYKLRPTLRIVDNLEVNTVRGTVADSLVEDVACNNGDNDDTGNAVYLFSGSDAAIQDLRGNATDPLTSATVTYNMDTSAYEFEIGYVPLGEYVIAFTCDATLDIYNEDNTDVMAFSSAFPVDATGEEDVVVDITDSISI